MAERPKRGVQSIYATGNETGRQYIALLERGAEHDTFMPLPKRTYLKNKTNEQADDAENESEDDEDEKEESDNESDNESDDDESEGESDDEAGDEEIAEANELDKWTFVKNTCRAIWPTVTQSRGRKMLALDTYRDLLSLEAMRKHAKWYKKIQLNVISNADTVDVVKVRADILSNMMVKKGFASAMTTFAIWIKYCDDHHAGDYAVYKPIKVYNFIPYRVDHILKNREEFLDQGHERRNLPEETAHEAARKVQSQIGKLAEIQGYMPASQLQKSSEIQSIIGKYKYKMEQARLTTRDFAQHSKMTTARVTKDERERALEVLLDGTIRGNRGKNVDIFHMRIYAIKYLEHNIIRRGQDLRSIHMAALTAHTIEDVEPAPCTAVCASIRHVKENTTNTEFVLSWISHIDPMQCSTIAIANYLVWVIDIYQLNILHEMRRDLETQPAWINSGQRRDKWQSEWWSYRLVFGQDPKKELSYDIHLEGENTIHGTAGYQKKSKKTSLPRTNNAHIALERGMNTTDLSHYGGWATTDGSAIGFYIDTAVKVDSSMTMNGWENYKKYYCARHSPDIPEVLCRQIFPGLDELYTLAKTTYENTRLDLSAVKFCELLLYLRRIFLEGAVDLRARYPNLPPFGHPVFDAREWRVWSRREPDARKIREGKFKLKEQDPNVIATLDQIQENMKSMIEKLGTVGGSGAAAQGQAGGLQIDDTSADRMKVPVIPIFTSISATYRFWDATLRPFLKRNYNRVSWRHRKEEAKRVDKFKPFCLYIDYVLSKSESEASERSKVANTLIEKLEDIRKEKEASYSAFIHSFKVAIQNTKVQAKNMPSHDREELYATLKAHDLPPPPEGKNVKAICELLGWK